MSSISEWILEKSTSEWKVYVKRLSANDTGLTGGHQSGVYAPKEVMISIFPSINRTDEENPDIFFDAIIVSHDLPSQELRAIYYNNKFFDGTRNERRITRWNTDVGDSPLQDPQNTGALAVFAFHSSPVSGDCDFMEAWICKGLEDEQVVEGFLGEVVPGEWFFGPGDRLFGGFALDTRATTSDAALPSEWLLKFPSGREIIEFLPRAFSFRARTPDELVLERRKREYELFRQIESRHVLDLVRDGFETVDHFMELANSVSNRRKSRSGKSLEIHLENLFEEYGLRSFGTQCRTEGNKKPDFLFPSCSSYHDSTFPDSKLNMLAVKTTCKDRWRQVLNEAGRIGKIHLFTLQEGVSPQQFSEMKAHDVTLVVPKPLHKRYPKEVRGELVSLGSFITEMKSIYG